MHKIRVSITMLLFVAMAIIVNSAPAKADTITFLNTTTGGQTFNRPLDTGTALASTFGTAVPYSILQFNVSDAGPYTFLSTATTSGYDPFLILYRNNFNPATPLTSFFFANDDLVPGNTMQSGFTLSLTTGISYFLVQTGFENDDFGNFALVINGPGAITAVPEPATLLLFGTGIYGVALRIRKRYQSHRDNVEL